MPDKKLFTINKNERIADKTYRMILSGDASAFRRPGQFANLKLEGFFLRRPISVCDYQDNSLTLIYKTVGMGTEYMSSLKAGFVLDLLTGLGNGFDTSKSGERPLLIGGGGGVPPLVKLTKCLHSEGKHVAAIIGFNTASEVYCEDELREAGADVYVTTVDGSCGYKGFAADLIPDIPKTYFYTCGPMPMYRAIRSIIDTPGEYSFEARMGCGFGACMGCSVITRNGSKRICKEGPVLSSEEIIWENM